MADINSILPLTKVEEGGLSRATSDTASKNPSPYVYKNQTGWHTNRGVTYKSFKSLSTKLGYTDNYQNFIQMPDSVWLKIAKYGYWNTLHLDQMKSQAIANIFFSWQWGAGFGWRNRIKRYFDSKNIEWDIDELSELPEKINLLVARQGEQKILNELVEQFKQFYISLNQPKNINGWLNRLERLKVHATKLLDDYGKTAIEIITKPNNKLLIVTILILGAYLLTKSKT